MRGRIVAAELTLVAAAAFIATPLASGATGSLPRTVARPATTIDPNTLHVEGNHLMVGNRVVQLNGFSHSGTEYMCSQGRGIFEGKVDNAAINAMLTWHPHIVRVTLNEDCWLGINGIEPQYGGATYQRAIAGYVHRLEAHGLYVDLDLHYAAPGTKPAGESNMADMDHSPEFWREVATQYGADRNVVFELYNEPHGISWKCLRDGCETHGFQAAGYQTLVDAVRGTGATNILLIGSRIWDGDLSHWLEFKPNDPLNQLTSYDGHPTPLGRMIRAHFRQRF